MKDFSEILVEEIKQMTIRIKDTIADRDRLQGNENYLNDKDAVQMCVRLTTEITVKQNARTLMKQALAAYNKTWE